VLINNTHNENSQKKLNIPQALKLRWKKKERDSEKELEKVNYRKKTDTEQWGGGGSKISEFLTKDENEDDGPAGCDAIH